MTKSTSKSYETRSARCVSGSIYDRSFQTTKRVEGGTTSEQASGTLVGTLEEAVARAAQTADQDLEESSALPFCRSVGAEASRSTTMSKFLSDTSK